MGVTNSNKVINTDRIECDGSLRVTLALTAAPDIVSNPTDIVLALDRSGSMTGAPLANMKTGAKTFIDIIASATGGTASGQIGFGSRIGIVSFSDTATVNSQLITSVDTLKNAVDMLSAGGSTNHADAFSKAIDLFEPGSSNAKVIVMFTDGNTTVGAPPAPVAASAKAQGIVIYCIGLIGSDGLDINALNTWASSPSASHVAVTPDEAELEALFAELAANITKVGATNIVIDEVVNSDFVITSVLAPSVGTATMLDSHSLKWNIAELGVTASESAILEFFIRHTAQTPGTKLVNESIDYSDSEGNVVTFPAPTVTVECGEVVHPEACPVPTEFTLDGCGCCGSGRHVSAVPGADYPDGCDHQECLPGQAGGPGGDPHGSGSERYGIPARHEGHDHSGAQPVRMPGCPGEVCEVCGSGGSGRLRRQRPGHVQPALF